MNKLSLKFSILTILFLIINIATNAQGWSELGGSNSLQANAAILSICSDAAGNIYAGGLFNHPGSSYYVAKYNDTTWSELGGTNSLQGNGNINSICSDIAGNIYSAGDFTVGYALSKRYVAKWSALGDTLSKLGGDSLYAHSTMLSICSDIAGNIYAAGEFTNTTGFYYVAKYNGTNWSELGGTNSLQVVAGIYAITSDAAGNIYAGGYFTNGSSNHYVAKWDHTTNTWSELGGANALQANGIIYSVASDAAGNIYTAGQFTNANGKRYVAKWDHTTNAWSELGGLDNLHANGFIQSIVSDGVGNVYTAGGFSNANGKQYVAKWDHFSNTWSELGGANSLQANAGIYSIAIDAASNIYAGGTFTNANNKQYVAKYKAPPVSISALQNGICTGTSVTCLATPVNVDTPFSYQWKVNGNNVGTNTSTYTCVPNNNDTISCVLITSSTSDTSNSIVMQVIPPVTPSITLIVNSPSPVNDGTVVTFTATAINGGSNPQYQWLKNNQFVSGVTNATWDAVAGTDFISGDIIAVRLISNAPCASPDTVMSKTATVAVNTTGISSVKNDIAINLYPNPNNGMFVLEGIVRETGNYQVVITNIFGQKMYEHTINITGQKLHATVSSAGLSQGMYYLKIIKDNGTVAVAKFEKVL